MTATELHAWVHPITLAYLPARLNPALEQILNTLLDWFRENDCVVQSEPSNQTDLMLTTAEADQPVDRNEALLFNAKRRFGLSRRPQVLTAAAISQARRQAWLDHFAALAKQPESEAQEHRYPGLGPQAVEVLLEQARRGGPEVALGRLLQGQVKSHRVMAVVHDDDHRPLFTVHYDLAGAHPTTDAADPRRFAEEAGRRIMTMLCTDEVANHTLLPDALPREVWDRLTSPEAMIRAGATFTQYGFFTTPVSVEKILGYRGIGEAIAAQYSEGCYAVYEPTISALVTTASGSSRLVDKRRITRDEQAVVVGVKPGRDGALVRPVEGMSPILPSVEAVEMMSIYEALSDHAHGGGELKERLPAGRAILHGHLGVESYDPARVESVFLDPPYYYYPVSCGTGALAEGTAAAFARSAALRNPSDPRSVIFLEQPGHGVVIVEKWVGGRSPFETIHQCLAKGYLKMTFDVPQGPVYWENAVGPGGGQIIRKRAPD